MSRPSDHSLIYTLLGGIAALIIVHGIGRFAYTPILPLMREDGLTLEQGGWLAAANYVGYLLGALFTVFSHGDRIQRLRGGLLVSIATTLLMGLTHALPAWLLLRFVSGLSNGVVFVYAANLVLERLALAGRSALGGLLYSGVGAGIVLSGLLVLAVDQAGWGWQAAWWGLALICALLLHPAWQLQAAAPQAASAKPAPAVRTPAYLLVVAGYGCAGLGYIVSMTFLPAIIRATPGMQQFAAWSWVILGLAVIPSSLFWSWAAQRWGEVPALLAAYGLQAIGVMAPLWWPDRFGASASALLLGGTFLGIVVMAMLLARKHDPHGGSRTVGVMTSAYGLAQIIGPLITAALAARPNAIGLALQIATVVLLLGAVCLIASALLQRKAATGFFVKHEEQQPCRT
jgi:predicted MFS family arabinose efflux permease